MSEELSDISSAAKLSSIAEFKLRWVKRDIIKNHVSDAPINGWLSNCPTQSKWGRSHYGAARGKEGNTCGSHLV